MWRGEENLCEERTASGRVLVTVRDRKGETRDGERTGKEKAGASEDSERDIAPPGEANDLKAERRLTAG